MGRWGTRTGPEVPVVTDVGLDEAGDLCRRDPVGSVLVAARLEALAAGGADRGGGSLWGVRRDGRLEAACWAGANLVPLAAPGDEESLVAFASAARAQGRRCSSIVGPAHAVLGMWARLRPSWGEPREVRPDQPSLVMEHLSAVPADPRVRRSRPEELPLLLPACVDMFVEEVGYSPLVGAPGAYEGRVRALVEAGRSFVRVDDRARGPQVVYKAELGAVSRDVVQVQGVWVAPDRRGQGLAAPAMAATVRHALAVAPCVSLYVNRFNDRALAVYERVGFTQVGTFATVLF
ncbi:GNAT family N-acetyltransferase [Cellulomonas bogoriensis]|nr:DUF4081 domain-containing GNAT family N-acetyltransferase [Cellulomonas bogoriensis]